MHARFNYYSYYAAPLHPRLRGWYLIRLVIVSLVIGLSACANTYQRGLDHTGRAIFTIFVPAIGAPEGYPAFFQRTLSYLYDDNEREMMAFGGFRSIDTSWGWGTSIGPYQKKHHFPKGINLQWFSPSENAFWRLRSDFNPATVERITQAKWFDQFHNEPRQFAGNYYTITINVTPSGLVVVWAGTDGYRWLVGTFQAERVDEDWEDFNSSVLVFQKSSREEFLKNMVEWDWISKEVVEQQRTKTFPSDGKPWREKLYTYPWRLRIAEPHTLFYSRIDFINAEQLMYQDNDLSEVAMRPLPYFLRLLIKRPDGLIEHIVIEMDNDEVMNAFKTMTGKMGLDPVEFYISLNYDFSKAGVYLINGDKKLQIQTKRLSLEKLHPHLRQPPVAKE